MYSGKYCDQIKTLHHHRAAEQSAPQHHHNYLPQQLRQTEHSFVNENVAKNNQLSDYLSFAKAPSQELQEQIDRDKLIHNFNEEQQHRVEYIPEPDTYHDYPFWDNNLPYYSSQSSRPQKPENNFSPSEEHRQNHDDLDFGFYQNPRHKSLPHKDRQKKRLRKQQQRRKRLRQNHPKHAGQPIDSFLDLDYIEEMFSGNMATMYQDYPTGFQQKPNKKHYGNNGYSMIEETDIDSIDRSFRNRRFFK